MSLLRPDLLVIGLDPAGIEAALGAAATRLQVVLVTQGGAAQGEGGLNPLNHLRALGGRVIEGQARFRDARHVFVEGNSLVEGLTIAARRVVLALPAAAPAVGLGFAQAPRWQAGGPARAVLIAGGGAESAAQAASARAAGHRAMILAPQGLLPGFDAEAVEALGDHLRRLGIELHAGEHLGGGHVEPCPEGSLFHPEEGAPIGFSHWLPGEEGAPDLSDLALEAGGIALEGPRPRLADGITTTNTRVLALGATRSALAHPALAGAEAGLVVGHVLLGAPLAKAASRLPRLARGPLGLIEAGLSEAALESHARASLRYYRQPVAGGGFLKAITDSSGRVLRFVVLAGHAPGLAGPLLDLLAGRRPLITLASLPLPRLEDAEALVALGRQAAMEKLDSFGVRLARRLARLLG